MVYHFDLALPKFLVWKINERVSSFCQKSCLVQRGLKH